MEKRSRAIKRICEILLIMAVAVSLAGCRYSPALVDTVYTADATEMDPNYTATQSVEEAEEENESQTNQEDEAENYNTEVERTDATQDDQADDNGSSRKIDNSPKKNKDASNSSGSGADNADASGGEGSEGSGGTGGGDHDPDKKESGSGGDGDLQETPDDPEDPDDPEVPDNPKEPEEPEIPDNPKEPEEVQTNVPKKVVTDADGVEHEIPEDVYSVTAVGAAAPIVAMVGGIDRLIGSSESYVSNALVKMLYNNDPNDQVNTWWSGDGSGQISEGNFEQLLEAKPDVCFEISGQYTFSSDQITRMEECGISYMPLPALSSSENMIEVVRIVADVLDTNESTGQAASTIAKSYSDWVGKVISDGEKLRDELEYYTIYISDWVDVSYQRAYEPGISEYIVDFPESSGVVNGSGSGVAVASADLDNQPFFELWEYAGIRDMCTNQDSEAYHYAHPQEWGYTGMYVFPYMTEFGLPVFSDESYFFPPIEWDEGVLKMTIYPEAGGIFNVCYGLTIPDYKMGDLYENKTHLGGGGRYSAIVVADEYVKSKIESSPQWQPGFLDGTSVEAYANDIAGDYDIFINPTGLGSWADGSVDAPLETYWIMNKISGVVSDSQLSKEVKNFYLDFFGITLSDAQIDGIINQ